MESYRPRTLVRHIGISQAALITPLFSNKMPRNDKKCHFLSFYLIILLPSRDKTSIELPTNPFIHMAKQHNSYTPEEKTQIILDILTRKTTIQKIAAQKNIAPTLVSLWKKQAEDAIAARFQPQPRGRRKSATPKVAEPKAEVRTLKAELRKARTKATRMENSLKAAKAQIATLEGGVNALATAMGCKLRKVHAPRRARKA